VSLRAIAAFVAVVGSAVAATLVLTLAGGDERSGEARTRTPRAVDVASCRGLGGDAGRDCYKREFLALVDGVEDPRPAVQAIADAAWRGGDYLRTNCHGIMHTVGRTYAVEAHLTLAALRDFLPKSNDPGCTAGFAHGLVTGIAPGIDPERPAEAARVCGGVGTRYQRYSCVHGFGHAFMRMYGERLEPALGLCRALGPDAAPDCAQGAYHDYWFAVSGTDGATLEEKPVTDPRRFCGAQPAGFVRPCWYRAFIERRPDGFQVGSAADVDVLCEGLAGLQREACITGASVIGPSDPAAQLRLCAGLEETSDAAACVRGTKVQNLLDSPIDDFVGLVGGCRRLAAAVRRPCYEWRGKAVAVITDGEFGRAGCPRLRGAGARRWCGRGAARIDEALVTFS
jgi:hypothetical protein